LFLDLNKEPNFNEIDKRFAAGKYVLVFKEREIKN